MFKILSTSRRISCGFNSQFTAGKMKRENEKISPPFLFMIMFDPTPRILDISLVRMHDASLAGRGIIRWVGSKYCIWNYEYCYYVYSVHEGLNWHGIPRTCLIILRQRKNCQVSFIFFCCVFFFRSEQELMTTRTQFMTNSKATKTKK